MLARIRSIGRPQASSTSLDDNIGTVAIDHPSAYRDQSIV
jgi:hypothetical protein